MPKSLTKREKIARATEYARTVETVDVLHADLRPGMVIVRPSGERNRVVSVGVDSRGIFAGRIAAWAARGVKMIERGMCYQTVRIDTFGLPDAELVREMEAAQGPSLYVCPPDVAHLPLKIEKSSIS